MRCSANEVHVQFFLEIFKAQRFHMGFFWGNILSRYFGFFWKPQGIFWVLIFAPMQSSPSFEIQSIPPGPQPSIAWDENTIKQCWWSPYVFQCPIYGRHTCWKESESIVICTLWLYEFLILVLPRELLWLKWSWNSSHNLVASSPTTKEREAGYKVSRCEFTD